MQSRLVLVLDIQTNIPLWFEIIVTSLRFLHEVVSPLTQGPWGSGSDFWRISEFVSLITHGRIAPPDRGQAIGESSGGVGMGVGSAVWRR